MRTKQLTGARYRETVLSLPCTNTHRPQLIKPALDQFAGAGQSEFAVDDIACKKQLGGLLKYYYRRTN